MLQTYIKTAWRNIIKNRSASIINITGLSLGMAAAVLILLWVQNELSFDSYHSHADRIYHVTMGKKNEAMEFGGTSELLAENIQKQIPNVEKATKIINTNYVTSPVLNINDNFFKEKSVVYADKEWFNIFSYDFIEGSAAAFNRNINTIIITEALAEKYFGTKDAIDQIIKIDRNSYYVKGVIKNNRPNSSFQFAIFLPVDAYMKGHSAGDRGWMRFTAETYILAKANTGQATLENNISSIFLHEAVLNTLIPTAEKADTFTARLTPIKKMHFNANTAANIASYNTGKKAVYIFSGLGFLLLFIASINYVNLSTARASKRSKEVSIKKIMGAGTKNLFLQFMAESVFTSVIALLLTMAIVRLSLPWFDSLTDKTFTLSLASVQLWEVLGGTLLITVLLTGIYPAVLLSSFKPLNVLRGMNILKVKNSALRKALVTAQFTIAIALSIATVVILKQLNFIQSNNDGYDRKQIFSFSIPGSWSSSLMASDKNEVFSLVKNELKKETAIEHVTISNDDIQNLQMSFGGAADWQNKKPDNNPDLTMLTTDADYRDVFKLQLIAGRWFREGNTADNHNYILSETTVAELGLKKPYLGQFFAFMNDTGQIIGVVKDFHFRDFHQKISASVLLNNPLFKGTFFVQANITKMNIALAKAETIFKKYFPHVPFEYKFMDASFEKMYRSDTKTATLVSTFSGIALFISCLGLFGLISFVAEQRTKEIGIRKILGATIINITTLLSKDFIQLVIIAIVIASPIAWWVMNKWLEAFAYRIGISWWIFTIAGIAAIFIALVTVSFQSVKAAMQNPVKSLRTE
jgi:putative ABC transport system permease protein